MPVGQIARPVAAVVHDLAQDHVGLGADVMVKDRVDLAVGGVAELALDAGILPGSILGSIQTGGKGLFVLGALDEDLSVLHCSDDSLHAAGNMQGPGAFRKDIFTGNGLLTVRPLEGDFAGEQQDRDLLAFPAELSRRTGSHTIDTDVHQHIAVLVLIGRKNLFTVFIKGGISE